MANITVSKKSFYEQELAERFVTAVEQLRGDSEGVNITTVRRRFVLSLPDTNENEVVYSYAEFEALVTQTEEDAGIVFTTGEIVAESATESPYGDVGNPIGEPHETLAETELEAGTEPTPDSGVVPDGDDSGDSDRLTHAVDPETGELELTLEDMNTINSRLLELEQQGSGEGMVEFDGMSAGLGSVIADLLKHADQGNRGKLAMGRDLVDLDRTAQEEGLKIPAAAEFAQRFFEDRGRKFPSKADRSRMRTSAKVWLEDTGYDLDTDLTSELLVNDDANPKTVSDTDRLLPMNLGSTAIDLLYTARKLVVPGNDEHNAEVMALCHLLSYRTLAAVAPHLTEHSLHDQLAKWSSLGAKAAETEALTWARAKKQQVEPEYKSIGGLPAAFVDDFKGRFTDEMTELAIEAGAFTPIDSENAKESERVTKVSLTFSMEMLVALWEVMPARTRMLLIKSEHGEATQEERQELFGVEDTVTVA